MTEHDASAANGTTSARIAALVLRVPEVWVGFVPLLYTIAVLAPPLLQALGGDHAADAVFAVFRLFCHQLPERTLAILGHPMAVCARCFALGASLALGALAAGRLWALGFRRFRPPLVLVAVAAVPMALDGFTQLFGLRESTNTLRVLTGGLLGGMTSLWTVPMVCAAFDEARGTGTGTGT